MTFKESQAFVMPIGKHQGRTLDGIASDDAGLRYLDWIIGTIKPQRYPELHSALLAYLADPTIRKELEALQ